MGQHQQRQLLGDKLNGPVVLMVLVLRQPVDALDHTQVVHRAGGVVQVCGWFLQQKGWEIKMLKKLLFVAVSLYREHWTDIFCMLQTSAESSHFFCSKMREMPLPPPPPKKKKKKKKKCN